MENDVWACSTNGRVEKCVQNFGRKLEGKRPLGRPNIILEDSLEMILRKQTDGVWTAFIWLNTGSSGGTLRTRQ
jgi:hypothetical protein